MPNALPGKWQGGFWLDPPTKTEQDIIALQHGDINNDGNQDLAMVSASSNRIVIVPGDGKGRFEFIK